MAPSLFRSLSSRVLERTRSRRNTTSSTPSVPTTPNNDVLPPSAGVVVELPEEEVEAHEEPEAVVYPAGLPLPPTTAAAATASTLPTTVRGSRAAKPRRRPSIFNRLHDRNASAESTATTTSTRSTASSFALSISSGATTLSRSVSTRARAAKRMSTDFMAVPMYQGTLVEDDAISLRDSDGAGCSFDIIL